MKKLVRTTLENTANRRGVKDLNIQFYSHDRNNAGFEFVIKNETDLSGYTAKVVYRFVKSESTWEGNGTIEENVVKVTFNTDLIARCEEVLGFLFLDSDTDSLDVLKFKFNVVLSEIDKGETEKRKIKHVADIEALELVTRSELKDELAKIQVMDNIDLSNYLTSKSADERYAKLADLSDKLDEAEFNKYITLIQNTFDGVVYKDDLPQPYDDSNLQERVRVLEDRPTTTYDDSEIKEKLQYLEPLLNYRPAPRIIEDSEIVERLNRLEQKEDKNTPDDYQSVKERLSELEGNYVSNLITRVSDLENKAKEPGKTILNQQDNQALKYWCGTEEEYNAIENKDDNTIYDIFE